MQGEPFHQVLANSDSIAEVRKRYCSENKAHGPGIPVVLHGNPIKPMK